MPPSSLPSNASFCRLKVKVTERRRESFLSVWLVVVICLSIVINNFVSTISSPMTRLLMD